MENYHIERPLAQGSTSSVFRVMRVSDRSSFVMKRINLEDASPRTIAAAEREVGLLQQLDHPCIVGLVDHFEVMLPPAAGDNLHPPSPQRGARRRGDLCLILEPMHHGDISQVLSSLQQQQQQQATISEPVVMAWFVQIALALHYLHSRGICHADMKTSNLFVDQNAQYVALGDLGSAHILNSSSQQQQQQHDNWEDSAVGGSPVYFSPERMSGESASFASDIWALGVLLLEIAAGTNPFADASDINQLIMRVCKGGTPQLPAALLAATVPGGSGAREIQKLVTWMLNPVAARRPGIEEVLRHPYVQRHLELFVRKLLAPPEAVAVERSPLRRGGGGSTTPPSVTTTTASRSDRWHKFVTGADRYNPHRLMLCRSLEIQFQTFLPTLFLEYQNGAGGGPPGQHGGGGPAPVLRQQTTPQHQQQSLIPNTHGRGKSSGGGPSSIQNFLSSPEVSQSPNRRPVALTPSDLLPAHQHQSTAGNTLPEHSLQFHRQYVPVVSNADLVPSINSSNTFSTNHRIIPSPDRGGTRDSAPQVIAPEHIAPTSLAPFQHQQLPLTQIRGQRTQAPFFTEDVGGINSNTVSSQNWGRRAGGGGGGGSGGGASNSQPNSLEPSPLRAAGGGSSSLSATPQATSQMISRLLGMK